ncbi:hypothetical protein [Tolumonas lignilytica]|uniref:hypothetical protein n=1 Tax=Tolumonas lignilytica TaxID=1283284 RepID=UPI0004654965|nr:hypothetical protein [Tolumonas lignilytica]
MYSWLFQLRKSSVSHKNMNKKLSIAAVIIVAALTGCATQGNFSKYTDHIKIKPISRSPVTGYSEQLIAYQGDVLKTTVNYKSGLPVMVAPTDITFSMLYEGTRYPITVKKGQYEIAGTFAWDDFKFMSPSDNKYSQVNLIPIAGSGVMPGVTKIALTGYIISGTVMNWLYAIQLESDHEWYVIADYDMRKSLLNERVFKFDATNVRTETVDIFGGRSEPVYFMGTRDGVMGFNCGNRATMTISGISTMGRQHQQRVGACNQTLVIDSFVGDNIIYYRTKLR